ncbi:MBL fold metallo-hydrolase [Streptomyces tropicalis]|uniref:MBL fold metallo-hydrolase n=1 Tax=Streptomyces tropicalis TaxID=3034234 RepID=A0ABT6A8V7_9ACTN|nr:MBL fold metallo-hydrolase [Streptomyces tropicalis]MDF3301090.1 MBL fold metallo-hydrolase [Streptomyces tropicalis]
MTEDSVQRFVIGDFEVFRVVEWEGPHVAPRAFVPDCEPEVWREYGDRLVPDHLEAGGERVVVALQTWVVRGGGRTVLVDTGVGNGRERPGTPLFHRRDGDFLGRLERAGVRPEDVDVVVNTHIHGDHVGWNTRDAGGEWVPAFPRARYLVPAADDHHFGPANGYAGGARPDDRLMYEDSVAPVHRAGLSVLWEGEHRIDGALTLEAAPGHTPGSSVLRLSSRGERAVFVGDLLHSPVQVVRPDCNSCFCLDARGAAASRRRILEQAADERELVVPAHFGGSGAVEVRREGGRFRVAGWDAA